MGRLIERFKKGSVVVTVWENEATVNGESRIIKNFTVNRVYRNKDTWQFGNHFRNSDLPDILAAVGEALEKYPVANGTLVN